MAQWNRVPLIDYIELIGGGTPKTTVPEYWNGNIPWLSVKDFNNDKRYVYSTEKHISQSGFENSPTKMLHKDDIIISARGTVGEIAMIPFDMAFNQSCYGIRASRGIDQPFLYYLLKNCISQLKRMTHGSVFDTITRDTFANIEVDIPDAETQKRISSVLADIDNKIEVNDAINDDFLRLMQEAGYEIKTGKYISFRAEGQERFTRSKTIGENYTEERIKERIAGRTPRRNRRQTVPKGISLIGDIQERIRLIDSKGYEYKAKLTILKEAARTLNYLTENNLLQYADLEKKVEDVHSSYDRTGKELKGVEARLREVQPLIKNISNYQRLKPVYDAFQKAKDKPGFKAKHEAELVIFEAARSTLLAMQGDEKLPSLKTLQAQQQQLLDEQQRLYDERAKLKKEVKQIETIKSNVDTFLAPSADHDRDHLRGTQRE